MLHLTCFPQWPFGPHVLWFKGPWDIGALSCASFDRIKGHWGLVMCIIWKDQWTLEPWHVHYMKGSRDTGALSCALLVFDRLRGHLGHSVCTFRVTHLMVLIFSICVHLIKHESSNGWERQKVSWSNSIIWNYITKLYCIMDVQILTPLHNHYFFSHWIWINLMGHSNRHQQSRFLL